LKPKQVPPFTHPRTIQNREKGKPRMTKRTPQKTKNASTRPKKT
jgi:hypothetical protein